MAASAQRGRRRQPQQRLRHVAVATIKLRGDIRPAARVAGQQLGPVKRGCLRARWELLCLERHPKTAISEGRGQPPRRVPETPADARKERLQAQGVVYENAQHVQFSHDLHLYSVHGAARLRVRHWPANSHDRWALAAALKPVPI